MGLRVLIFCWCLFGFSLVELVGMASVVGMFTVVVMGASDEEILGVLEGVVWAVALVRLFLIRRIFVLSEFGMSRGLF